MSPVPGCRRDRQIVRLAATSHRLRTPAATLLADCGATPDQARDQLAGMRVAEAPELAERLNDRSLHSRVRMRRRWTLVIHRKLSLGTQSRDGERFAQRALSAATTCRMQHRSLFIYLTELLAAHNHGDPIPALT